MTIDLAKLRHAWEVAWRGIGAHGDGEAELQRLVARYSEPHRHYHTLQHLAECLAHFEANREQAAQPHETAMALLFHDAIYDVSAHDNEALSATVASEILAAHGAAPDAVGRVRQLILATQHQTIPADGDEQFTVDIDLAILGAPPERYQEYEGQVRQEYAHLPDAVFWRRRGQLLQEFLARPAIYATTFFRPNLEQPARENLRRSLSLSGAASARLLPPA